MKNGYFEVFKLHPIPVVIQNWPYPSVTVASDVISAVSVLAFILLTWKIISLTKEAGKSQDAQTKIQGKLAELNQQQVTVLKLLTLESVERETWERLDRAQIVLSRLEALNGQIKEIIHYSAGDNVDFRLLTQKVQMLVPFDAENNVEKLGVDSSSQLVRRLGTVEAQVQTLVLLGHTMRDPGTGVEQLTTGIRRLREALEPALDKVREIVQVTQDELDAGRPDVKQARRELKRFTRSETDT